MKSLKLWSPKFIENSKIPEILSKISPVDIWAISLTFWVFCRGEASKTVRRHETIHFQQWLELGIIGFMVLYPVFYLIGVIRHRDFHKAYTESPFEKEAYSNERKYTYLTKRKRFAWVAYIRT
jgi:hypothetical protein